MNNAQQFADVAGLIAEPNRAIMLWYLLDGRAYTAGELAAVANISPQAASNHIHKLLSYELLKLQKQGRHRYYALARPEIAYAIEALANLLPEHVPSVKPMEPVKNGIKYARTCYDHLAGKMGVQITQAMVAANFLIARDKYYEVTSEGQQWFASIGIDTEKLAKAKRNFAIQCLDWSERKHHLGGALGAALLRVMLEKDWIRKKQGTRAVVLTHAGQENLDHLLSNLNTNLAV